MRTLLAALLLASSGWASRRLLYVESGLQAMNETLKAAASRIPAFEIGSQNNEGHVTVPGQYPNLLEQQYAATVAENSCKWGSTEQGPNQFNFSTCIADQSLVTGKGMLFRLHNLCWGNYNPEWVLNSSFTAVELEGYLQEHIDTAIRTVGPKSWVTDVVNEPFCNSASQCDPSNSNLKDMNPWYPKVKDYLALAFTTARKAADKYAPHLKLFVNDYSILTNSFKADCVLAGIKQLQAESIPIDGLGVQAHLGSSEPNGASWKQTLQSFKDIGMMTQITEMDTACGNPCEGDAAAKQAQVYGDVLTACLATKATSFGTAGCGAHLTWGFTDKYTWLNKNGKIVNPLPFDANYQPKPAAMEMLSVLQHWAAGIRDPTRPWAYE